jgi:hypothetical protein
MAVMALNCPPMNFQYGCNVQKNGHSGRTSLMAEMADAPAFTDISMSDRYWHIAEVYWVIPHWLLWPRL